MEAVREEIPLEEIIHLAAIDDDFYGRHFFPKTIRQQTPPFHKKVDLLLADPEKRHLAIKIFRGGAKTTKLRVFTSKRIAYGVSHTILFISKTQDHALKTINWIKKNVEYNKLWSQTFGLKPGPKWTGEEITILHGVEAFPITVVALGITGQTRGVNIDDYRPDLIVVDDPCDEINTATFEQREKISNIFFGALEKSLAPRSESWDAKMVLLQTPLDGDDLIERCMKDPQWHTAEFSCFDDSGDSNWPARWSTEELLADKQAHIDRNQLSLWMREMEVKIVSPELSHFRQEWLMNWDVLPDGMITYIGVDPTPPPKDAEQKAVLDPRRLDDAAIVAFGLWQGKAFLLDYYTCKSPNPDELISKIFEFVIRFKPLRVGFESILFARTIKFYLEKEMRKRHHFFTVEAVEDRRKKSLRIVQAYTARASGRTLYVHRTHTEFIEQFVRYPNVEHDDLLDAGAIALDMINPILDGEYIEGIYEILEQEEKALPDLGEWRSAI